MRCHAKRKPDFTTYKMVNKPHKGFGKVVYNPGDWLTRSQCAAFLNVPPLKIKDILHRCKTDKLFRLYGAKITVLRRHVFLDFQSACYLYQFLKKEKTKSKKDLKKQQLRDSYYDREYAAYLNGELRTRPQHTPRYFEAICDLGLDPFKG